MLDIHLENKLVSEATVRECLRDVSDVFGVHLAYLRWSAAANDRRGHPPAAGGAIAGGEEGGGTEEEGTPRGSPLHAGSGKKQEVV